MNRSDATRLPRAVLNAPRRTVKLGKRGLTLREVATEVDEFPILDNRKMRRARTV